MPKSRNELGKVQKKRDNLDYPLQGTRFDVPLSDVLSASAAYRKKFVRDMIIAFAAAIRRNEMALKRRTSFAVEMRDLRKLYYCPADQYLFTDDKNGRRWVLGKGSPGSTHVYWSRQHIWKMKTKIGSVYEQIIGASPRLHRDLERFLDPQITSKEGFRRRERSAILNVLSYLEFDRGSGCAFPPCHMKFLADKYLPKNNDAVVLDPCAGWGGRLLGTLLVNRATHVKYIGVDPEKRNKEAYDGLTRRVTVWLKKEIIGSRSAEIFYEPFEDWVKTSYFKQLRGSVDLIMTSPPYFGAENYNPENQKQSANRYLQYQDWREGFYRALFKGAYSLLKPSGHFILNIADVAEAPSLERDARALAGEIGFVSSGFYKLAMSMTPATRKAGNARCPAPFLCTSDLWVY